MYELMAVPLAAAMISKGRILRAEESRAALEGTRRRR